MVVQVGNGLVKNNVVNMVCIFEAYHDIIEKKSSCCLENDKMFCLLNKLNFNIT